MSTEIGKLYQEWVREDETIEEQEFQNEFGGAIDERDATAFYAGYMACQKQNNWISVDDRLPEIILDEHDMVINNVLVCSEKGNVQIQLSSQLHDTMKEGSFYYKIFTHWQPLPESPL